MSDIFISYKREEQAIARKLANALESEGWTVWWDPKLRAGDDFDEVIEKVLAESRCVIVLWSEMSLKSKYVRAEAAEALEQNKLVPVAIENVSLPFRFKRLHTAKLLNWDGSGDSAEFRKLVDDITEIIGPAKGERKTRRTTSQPSIDNLKPGTNFRDSLKDGSTRVPGVEQPKAKLNLGADFRDKLKTGSQGPEMVVIPAGTFEMGDIDGDLSGSERPVHTVEIIRPFAIGRYQVTFEEYDRFAKATGHELPSDNGWGRGQRPVIKVSWDDAAEYAKWLSAQTGRHYRLPTEAEWEYAARSGGKKERWAGTSREEELRKYAWYKSNSGDKTKSVGNTIPNSFGLYDMSGNVWEWVQDCWHYNYGDVPRDGSAWGQENDGDCSMRVVRGGSWYNTPGALRASIRFRFAVGLRENYIGFRLAQDLD